jgi:hypothetical protein
VLSRDCPVIVMHSHSEHTLVTFSHAPCIPSWRERVAFRALPAIEVGRAASPCAQQPWRRPR